MKGLLSFSLRFITTIAMTVVAIVVGLGLWNYYMDAPWTRDGRVRADIVAVAPDVSGLVTDVLVKDNQKVSKGDVLFRIDPARFRIALREAEAQVAGKKAVYQQAAEDYARYQKLSDVAVTQQKLDVAVAAEQTAKAAYDQALADRDLAQLNLTRSEVRASVSGRVTNMSLRPGAYVTVGHGTMALIDDDTLRVEGYFEETKLPRIQVGDAARVELMGDPRVLKGHVESIAAGIADRERSDSANLLASVNPTFAWVRLAQRVPVRVKLDDPHAAENLVAGQTATVTILTKAPHKRVALAGFVDQLATRF
jgi:multidrug resistance efflux pump